MLSQYKNIEEINTAKQAVSADRFGKLKRNFFAYDANNHFITNTNIVTPSQNIQTELHVYSGDNWITGNHKIVTQTKLPQFKNPDGSILNLTNPIGIDLVSELKKIKLASGNFKFVVNFFENLVGSYDRQHLRIDEISSDRTEIRLRAIDSDDAEYLQQITNYISNVDQTGADFYESYILNFSRNQCILFVNSVVLGEYLYVKLFEPLPDQFDVDFKCWVTKELKPAYIDNVSLSPESIGRQFNSLAGPNWQANAVYNTSTDTGLQNWTELLGSSLSTSQQIVDSYFSGSLDSIKLNIDYSDFNNFVFYSSATERLANFKYKLELIEYYTNQSSFISTLSGSVATTNVNDFDSLKTALIGGFDGFENYLYYQSSSQLTTFNIPLEFANIPELTGSYIQPVPKSTSTYPYTLQSVNSTEFINWYNTAYESASFYDTYNTNILLNSIPEHVRYANENDNLIAFTNMLGQHYDVLYTYINHMTKINKREENPKLGMPNELLYSVAKQFGWNLTNGKQDQKLWEYVLGTNESGIPLTGSNSVGDPAVSGKDMTYSIWRRIVNNLPMLLKSKGTKRSVRALLACYGIPQSFISINEYGGPRIDRTPIYEKLNFDYALDLIANPAGTVTVNYTQPINSVELRFRTDDVVTNPSVPSTMNLFNIGSNAVTLDFQSGTMGKIKINGTGSANIEMFDGGWITALLKTSGSALQVIAKRSKYGKIVSAVSASATASFSSTGTLTLGGTSSGASRLLGQLQELRLWTSSLQDTAFNNHVKAPGAYNGNTDAYDELVFRLPLNEKINHNDTASLTGYQPKASTISASFASWTTATPYDSLEETYYYDAPSVGGGNYDDNKIRLEANSLVGQLDIKTRSERSQYDRAPLDSKRVGVYFSPQTMIDEDIIAQLGFAQLDQYIGDPGNTKSDSYPELERVARQYWKKYQAKNNINDYINMFTLFDLSFFKQLEQLLPARAEKLTGIIIQPNLLERNKDTILPTIQRFDSGLNSLLENIAPSSSGEYRVYESIFSTYVATISGTDDDQIQAYITASNPYDSTPYSYEYLIHSGSGYITASTPYWASSAEQPVIVTNALSEYQFASGSVTYSTSSGFVGTIAQVQSYIPTGIANQRYNGAKMTSPAFNVNSTQTVDGGPVVEWSAANPNQLIYSSNGNDGSFVLQ